MPTNWRITQARDPVPLVPDDDIYYHTHGEVYFEKSGIDLSVYYLSVQRSKCADFLSTTKPENENNHHGTLTLENKNNDAHCIRSLSLVMELFANRSV